MKNHWKLALLPALPLLLTACTVRIRWQGPTSTVNWQGITYTVPWYVVWVPVLFMTAIVLVATHLYFASRTYRCPQCGHVFKPRKRELSLWLHCNNEHVAQCPQCGRKGFCPRMDL